MSSSSSPSSSQFTWIWIVYSVARGCDPARAIAVCGCCRRQRSTRHAHHAHHVHFRPDRLSRRLCRDRVNAHAIACGRASRARDPSRGVVVRLATANGPLLLSNMLVLLVLFACDGIQHFSGLGKNQLQVSVFGDMTHIVGSAECWHSSAPNFHIVWLTFSVNTPCRTHWDIPSRV